MRVPTANLRDSILIKGNASFLIGFDEMVLVRVLCFYCKSRPA